MKNLLIYSFIFLFSSICFGQSDFKDLDNKNTGLVSILQFSLAKNYEAHQVVNIPNTGSRGTDLSVSKSFAKSLNVVLGLSLETIHIMNWIFMVWLEEERHGGAIE